ncbi:hypothetical protein F2P81_001363 [Scophthalmus maximus]|uniref:CCHC-type domain-containing protein n=1 Tax=Scophthalmus maximus TaxID=52904 RepID=A0A6A4TVM6_SCOMX|nr:hypothetical protein F2P81_001363 [Scophthalmus maximus]
MQLGRSRLTPEERNGRFRERLCLYCGEPNHQLVSCPHRLNAQPHQSQTGFWSLKAKSGKMSAASSQKVVLKSTTKVSLNERFTNMLKNKQPTAVSIRATMQQQHLASARNRRLAQQMENRPSVQAALNHKQGRECLQVSPCEAVALLAVMQCVEEPAIVEDLLEEEGLCPEEHSEEV